jgi:hypothetical protein
MLEESTDGELGEHFGLDSAEDFGEIDLAGVGMAGHGGLNGPRQTRGESIPKGEAIDGRQDRLSYRLPRATHNRA